MRPLFVAGCPRSGTTAIANYLNVHPSVMVTIERYNHTMPITPDLFTPDRLTDFRDGETRQAPTRTLNLLASKDWKRLEWVGDKRPRYFLVYDEIATANAGAHFIYMYRPLSDVALSFVDHDWPLTLEHCIQFWNTGLRRSRRFVAAGGSLLVVDYDGFFAQPEAWVPVLGDFLGLEFGPDELAGWRALSALHADRTPRSRTLTEEQDARLRAAKAVGVERWALRQIEDKLKGQRAG